MSKVARKLRHSKIMAEKRAVKSRRRALYASLAGTSRKTKRKRVNRGQKQRTIWKHAHTMTDCGNVGCNRCYPR